MQNQKPGTTLFEVSWEVCNKVGGIYAVVSSKALEAVEKFGDNYYMLGPDMGNNADFEETDEPCWDGLRQITGMRNLSCRFGRWNIPGNPKVILVNFKDRYNQNQLLYELWSRYGVDSLSGGWDYAEPVMFSTACGEIIAAACEVLSKPSEAPVLAHLHEWMCGGGLLAIKKLNPSVGTIFTTHATMLGRSMAGSGFDIYKQMNQINPNQEAGAYNITAKCSMESTSAKEADCFTTVSQITADEASTFLGRAADFVTPNGLDLRVIPDYSVDGEVPQKNTEKILEAAGRLLRTELPSDTRIFLISGRYEFHNKGIDVFMDALAGVNKALSQSQTSILALCTVMGGHSGVNPDAISGDPAKQSDQGPNWISSHYVYNQPNDPILKNCAQLGLDNNPDNPVKFIFIPALLDGNDGFLNMEYSDVMSACDLGVFPSWYEPWGYTPQESAALSVPTVTTDLSGFGHWVRDLGENVTETKGVIILPRRQTSYEDTVKSLQAVLLEFASVDEDILRQRRKDVRAISGMCSWQEFFPHYLKAYNLASEKAAERDAVLASAKEECLPSSSTRLFTVCPSSSPVLHSFTAITKLPQEIERLRELANNLWWSWHPQCWELFSDICPEMWEQSGHNPIRTIENATRAQINALAQDQVYLQLYNSTMAQFDAYMSEPVRSFETIVPRHPIAYFSMEYGLSECLPIYSGGLGVLSGDHLKSASDLNIPFVGIGLLYKSGYFRQQIDKDAKQLALYPENDFSTLPIERVVDINGDPLNITLSLPNRIMHAQVWLVRVGRVPLYLMDTDTPLNTIDDRKVTARLYEADRDYRLRQEILLGIGGIKLLRALGIAPSVHHMNEGHSAFLILERIRGLMQERGMTFAEASEYVKSGNIFTTHTPVEAGNEHFTLDRMKFYFQNYAQSMGLSWADFIRTGRVKGSERNVFEMTVLALNFSHMANGVSKMHGVVSRNMWQRAWSGVPAQEIPIKHITNGVHVPSYTSPSMKILLDRHLGEGWMEAEANSSIWDKVMEIPDNQLLSAKFIHKNALLDKIRESLPNVFKKFDLPSDKQKEMLAQLTPKALIIGFARRFAPYKRATLLFADPDRLCRILNNMDRPVLFVFAGKAHPADTMGADIMQSVIKYMLDPRFFGRIYFIEDYNLAVSRLMVQGCDVWLNTPRRPYEASGTSGQKISSNAGINLSVSDGWWCEGFEQNNGWTIGPVLNGDYLPTEQSDYEDAESLYSLLEESVVPLYFERDSIGMPHAWLNTARHAMRSLIAQFNSINMVRDYLNECYIPTADYHKQLKAKNMTPAKELAQWKQSVASRFSSIKINEITIDGVDKDTLIDTNPLAIAVNIDPGSMDPAELTVQLVVGPGSDQVFLGKPDVLSLEKVSEENGSLLYQGSYLPQSNGPHVFGVRIMPTTKDLASLFDTGLVLWG